MIITKDQYREFIVKGTILRRTIYIGIAKNREYSEDLEVMSSPYNIHSTFGNYGLKVFKYRKINQNHGYPNPNEIKRYYLDDLFNGIIEILYYNTQPFIFIKEDEFTI
jgi:hypothetical protein